MRKNIYKKTVRSLIPSNSFSFSKLAGLRGALIYTSALHFLTFSCSFKTFTPPKAMIISVFVLIVTGASSSYGGCIRTSSLELKRLLWELRQHEAPRLARLAFLAQNFTVSYFFWNWNHFNFICRVLLFIYIILIYYMNSDWLLKSTRSSQFFFGFGLGRETKSQFKSSLTHAETFRRRDERVKIDSHALNFVSSISDFVGLQVRYYRRCLQSKLWFSCHFGYARYELIQLDKCIGKIKVLSIPMRFQKYVFLLSTLLH